MEKKSQDHDEPSQDDMIDQSHNDPLELDALLAGITPENIHKEVDFGPATGKEEL